MGTAMGNFSGDDESHEDERQRPADATGIPQILDLKPILIKIHHDGKPTVFGTRTVQEDKWQFEELKTAEQRQEYDTARHRSDLREDHMEKFLPAIGSIDIRRFQTLS
jgi:hypothetical protein